MLASSVRVPNLSDASDASDAPGTWGRSDTVGCHRLSQAVTGTGTSDLQTSGTSGTSGAGLRLELRSDLLHSKGEVLTEGHRSRL